MLKFFRNIRKQFIEEKKISNYLLYAVGEIVLVVIGILIALAIDNANELSIKKEKEQIYLMGLKDEFQTSKLKLQELMRVNRASYEAAKDIVHLMDQEENPPEKQLSKLFIDAFASDIFFNPNNSLLFEMINSGSLKDITNDTLRIRLTNWVATIDDIANQEKFLGEQRTNIVDWFRTEGHSIRTILENTGMSAQLGIQKQQKPISNLSSLKSVDFENNILLFIITSQSTTEHYTVLMEGLDNILKLLEAEIEP
ncbi:hypothetical protein LDL77_12150 [Flagellimonas marinaquae]|uniref:Uncharacterized protein n=1 Tax=Flagellimonas aurea TaxID=2915619 RepID=A0ABS3G5A8_9FLAO|nr:DUF6090 family protein [Allomuricauda aurea]MAO18406.1 hypothetical protein [Allomuricauda sp.]MBO0354605.1 hypothetical protein [Allomuricauda aurea]UBZ12641.1 hypothetical protein LDL77_12150 [Allomuricauda aquimarina]|tara:strand:+ start:240 stop:1001 length:762 start_codon:yes stop_codon:yes gene_type:complete